MQEHSFFFFADYSQIFLQNEDVNGDLLNSWTEQATEDLLELAPGTIGLGTVGNMEVPVTLARQFSRPDFEDSAEWDHTYEVDIGIPSGRIIVAGCTDCLPDAARIMVAPRDYRARIQYGGLGPLTEDGLDGSDHYEIDLWAGAPEERRDIKRRRSVLGN